MSDEGPSKLEIQQVFKRLKGISANKACFDCCAKNPTWSSVTYGVFICMDCSAVHRSLGVHLSFVRSTQLDTNWSWVQVRHMQLGGNANAEAFFRSHGCNTTDAQKKYNSRAAQLYREKLHSMALQAMRVHGTTLHVGGASGSGEPQTPEATEKPVDFFEEHSNGSSSEVGTEVSEDQDAAFFGQAPERADKNKPKSEDGDNVVGPSVEGILSTSPTKAAPVPKKSSLGARKPAAKKTGLGGKKGGLGAQKVRADFDEIEREAEMQDQILLEQKTKKLEEGKILPELDTAAKREELASLKLSYEALSREQDKARSAMNPQKAEQAERLGMGFGGGFAAPTSGVSHSIMSEMKQIQQERPSTGSSSKSKYSKPASKDFFAMDSDSDEDDNGFEHLGFGSGSKSGGKGSSTSSSFFAEQLGEDERKKSGKSSWEKDLEARTTAMKISTGYSDSSGPSAVSASSSRAFGASASSVAPPPSTEEQLKKFANAKSISSDQFFGGRELSYEEKMNLSRFEGSSSISSDAYFGRETEPTAGRRGYASSMSAATPDLDDVKESVRQGVTKVAGKLSNLASGVMQQIQDRYGY